METNPLTNRDFFNEQTSEDLDSDRFTEEDINCLINKIKKNIYDLQILIKDVKNQIDVQLKQIEDLIEPKASLKEKALESKVDPFQEIGELSLEEENGHYLSQDSEFAPDQDQGCRPHIQPYQFNVKHLEWKGIGYNTGYTSLQGFFAPSIGSFIPFIDLRGHVFNNRKLAANAGLGLRYVIDSNKYMVGINGYYDYRETNHYHYNQVGAGLEAFLDRWEIKANAYLPVGTKSWSYTSYNGEQGIAFERFQGHYLFVFEPYIKKIEKMEFAMKGFDAEVGVHRLEPTRNYDLYIAAGPYYFHGKQGKNAWGGKLRVRAEVMKYLFLEINDSYDQVFHNRFQGQASISIPFEGRTLRRKRSSNSSQSTCFADNVMRWRGSQPVQRQEIVVVNKHEKSNTVDPIAIDPATGQPFYFVFVNNTNTNSAPDGTFENPFANLSTMDGVLNAQDASVDGNIIYVFSGDGTSNHMANGISLKSNQRFLGSGISNLFITTMGQVAVPPQTTSSPAISSSALTSPVVMLMDVNEVSGFGISIEGGSNSFGIQTGGMGGNFVITRNTITGNSTSNTGINVVIYEGSLLIDQNVITSIGLGGGGIDTSIMAGMFPTMTISNNMTNSVGRSGIAATSQSGDVAYINILGNQLESSDSSGVTQAALLLNSQNAGLVVASVGNNICNNTVGDGMTVQPEATVFLSVYNNQFTNNSLYGMRVGSPSLDGQTCLYYTNNISTSNALGGYYLDQVDPYGFYLGENSTGNIGSLTTMGTFKTSIDCVPHP